jgi:RHS repeat-associated protein
MGSGSNPAPMAYLNFITFDRNYLPILTDPSQSNFIQITTSAREDGTNVPFEQLSAQVIVKQPGYMYIWLSNENPTPVDVYFDDITVQQINSPVMETTDFFPFGAISQSYQREGEVPQNYKYQKKEYQTDLGLNLYDFHARQYDPWTLRTTTMDPHGEKYSNLSSYSWCSNNPVVFVDPTGKDVAFDIARNKQGQIIGITLRSTIYITGVGATEGRAGELNNAAGDVFKSRTVNNVKISFDIKYQYKKDFDKKDLKAGDNVLNFVNKPSNYKSNNPNDVSHTNSYEMQDPNSLKVQAFPGNSGEIHKDDWNNNLAVFHESLHFTGLIDRYYKDGSGKPMPGFENDLMGNRDSPKIGYDHYQAYYDRANNPYFRNAHPNGFISTIMVDYYSTSPSQQQIDEQK